MDDVDGQAMAPPVHAVGIGPAAFAVAKRAMQDGTQQPVHRHETGGRGLRQALDLLGLTEQREQTDIDDLTATQPHRDPGDVQQVQVGGRVCS